MSMLRGDEAPAAGFPNSSLVSDCEPYQMDSETREPISHPLARPSGMNWPVALDPVRPGDKPASFPH